MCIVLIQGNEKRLMKFAAVLAKMLKIPKCLPKVLFNIGIVAFCLFPCFCILFARRLESVTKDIYVQNSSGKPEKFRTCGCILNI